MNTAVLLLILAIGCGLWCALSVSFIPHASYRPSDGAGVVLSIIVSGLSCIGLVLASAIIALVNVIGG